MAQAFDPRDADLVQPATELGGLLVGMARFRADVFPAQQALYSRLARDGQQPKALVISCSDSRVVPELITQSGPGELFVCRNAGNIVPPYTLGSGGVSAAIEYAVVALGVRDIVVCGHSECGAMGGLLHPEKLEEMPNVSAWLRHAQSARSIVCTAYPAGMSEAEMTRALALENVSAQLNNLRGHPSVAARLAAGALTLHGWFFDIRSGTVLALDGTSGRFGAVEDESLPIAVRPERRLAASGLHAVAAE